MKSVVIANAGNSDLGKEEKPYFDVGNINIYEKSKELYENKNFNFEAIILEPIIKELIKEYEIEKLYLFATEQRPFHQKDTKYIASIIKEILNKKFKIEVEIIPIDENPSDYDEMFSLYERELRKISMDADVIHISITGGTPAQNMALLIRSMLKFGNIVQIIYKPMGTKEIKKFKIGEEITKILLSERLNALKKRHLYGAAAELAEESNILSQKEVYMLRAADHRGLFDFEESVDDLKRVFNATSGEEKARVKKEIEELNRLKEGLKNIEPLGEEYFLTYKALIKELYTNMKQKWEQGAYADFLGRLFRFEEAVLRYLFEREFKVNTEKDEKGEFVDFQKFVKSNNSLMDFLDHSRIDPRKPDRRVLFMILTFLKKENSDRMDIKEIQERIGRIEKMADLRNKSILAHGFEGISKRDFEKYGNILEDIDIIIKKL